MLFDPEKVEKYNAMVMIGPGVTATSVVLGDEYNQLLKLYREVLEELEAARLEAKGEYET